VSHAVAAQLDPHNVVVVHDTPDPAALAPARAGRFRTAAGIPDDAPLVGAAGRIDTWKGFEIVLDAFARVCTEIPDARLVIAGGVVAGKEPYAAQLAARTRALPGALWLGPRSDLPDVFADLDVFVMASTEPEPYGLVAVEALASGVPVVATDRGGPLDIATGAAPGTVRLVGPGDAASLARALLDALHERGRSSSTTRRQRSVLTAVEPPPFAELFEAVAGPGAGSGAGSATGR
jgi:glycosyltransferase involved in cell wall biosynthesis